MSVDSIVADRPRASGRRLPAWARWGVLALVAVASGFAGATVSRARLPGNEEIGSALLRVAKDAGGDGEKLDLSADASLRVITFFWLDHVPTRVIRWGDWELRLENVHGGLEGGGYVVREDEQQRTRTFSTGARTAVREGRVVASPVTPWARLRGWLGLL